MARWKQAVKLSLEFDVAIVQIFDRFAQVLLQTAAADDESLQQLLQRITWAEQLTTQLTRSVVLPRTIPKL
jgi:hypothetical protein